jgi:hypothetical protein
MNGKSSFNHAINLPEFINRKKAEKYGGANGYDFKGAPVGGGGVASESARHRGDNPSNKNST